MSAAISAAVIGAGAAVYGAKQAGKAGKAGAKGADAAAQAQLEAQELAIAEQRRQFDTSLGLSANQRTIGNQALNSLAAAYGFNPAAGFGADYTSNTGVSPGDPRNELRPEVGGVSFTSDEILPLLQQGKTIDEILRLGRLTSSGNRLRNELKLGEEDIARLRGEYIAPGPGMSDRSRQSGTAPQGYSEFGFNGDRFSAAPGQPVGNALSPMGGFSPNPQANVIPSGGGDFSKFFTSPDYEFRKKEGLDAVQSSAAARGGLYSGNALRGITDFASNLAAGEYGDWFNRAETLRGNEFNRLASLAGIGNTATQQVQGAAQNTGNNIGNILTTTGRGVGNALIDAGNARASGILGQADAIGQGLNNLGGIAGYYYGQRQQPYGGYNAFGGIGNTKSASGVPYYLQRPM